MLGKITSQIPEFKTVTFQRGFNILIAEKSNESSDTDSRNGAGKSSLIEILHFTLGLSRLTDSVLRKEALKNYSFTLTLDWNSKVPQVSVTRSLTKRNQIVSTPNAIDAGQHVGAMGSATNREWTEAIGRDLFSFPLNHAGLSARGLVSLYVRRDSQKGFNDPISTFPRQSITEATTNIAYLLGLNWRLVSNYQNIAARERLRKELTKATKDPIFGLVIGSASELRGQIVAATRRVEELSTEIKKFNVVPEYESIQRQADEIDEKIRNSRMRDAADRRNLSDFENALASESEPDAEYVFRVYQELGLVLPDSVTRTYDEVLEFHASVTLNRRTYLETELAATRNRIENRTEERNKLGTEHARLLNILNEGGALDAYTEITTRLSTAEAQLDSLRSRFDTAKKLEATKSEIKLERLTLKQQIAQDLEERATQVATINELFQRFSAALYSPDREAYIQIDPLETSLKIRPHIGGEDSRGIGQMTMFCFDLTWAVIAHREGHGPDFLVHDSHLFDGVDERQVARAFKLAVDICEQEDMQYIVTMNSDDLSKTETFGFDPNPYIIDPKLYDTYEHGGLFGIQFM
ncbi:ABC-three component system protein [Glutamicibacter sp. AOP38-B1-38]|uniref:ABC-three component system protein n=1 Tax=Glutamicibacter sp. AOP38-B1-38 TaxID=3457680 RepID=UPI0040334A7C